MATKAEAMEALNLLGLKVEDRVTGYEGVVTSVCYDLYGCIQAIVHPGRDEKGRLRDATYFDVGRLKVVDNTPVMDLPEFVAPKGSADKPAPTAR